MDMIKLRITITVSVCFSISTAVFIACMICAIGMPCMVKVCSVAIKDPTRIKEVCCRAKANRPEEVEFQNRRTTFTDSFSVIDFNNQRKQSTIQPVNYDIL